MPARGSRLLQHYRKFGLTKSAQSMGIGHKRSSFLCLFHLGFCCSSLQYCSWCYLGTRQRLCNIIKSILSMKQIYCSLQGTKFPFIIYDGKSIMDYSVYLHMWKCLFLLCEYLLRVLSSTKLSGRSSSKTTKKIKSRQKVSSFNNSQSI